MIGMPGEMQPAAKAAVIRDDQTVLLIKRSADETHLEGYWDIPGGRFEYGETPQKGLKRETREEAGIRIRIVDPVAAWSFMKDDGQQIIGTTFLCTPETTDVDLGPEHTDYRWTPAAALADLQVYDDLRTNIRRAFQHFNR